MFLSTYCMVKHHTIVIDVDCLLLANTLTLYRTLLQLLFNSIDMYYHSHNPSMTILNKTFFSPIHLYVIIMFICLDICACFCCCPFSAELLHHRLCNMNCVL